MHETFHITNPVVLLTRVSHEHNSYCCLYFEKACLSFSIYSPHDNVEEALLLLLISESMVSKIKIAVKKDSN